VLASLSAPQDSHVAALLVLHSLHSHAGGAALIALTCNCHELPDPGGQRVRQTELGRPNSARRASCSATVIGHLSTFVPLLPSPSAAVQDASTSWAVRVCQ